MPALQPTIHLIAGCNGAGKTTFAKEFLPKEVKCLGFLNADTVRFQSHMKSTARQKNGKGAPGARAALRALRRAARKVHAENRKLGLPVIIWVDGKVVEVPA